MLVGALQFLFVCIGLAAVIPTPATEPHLTKSVSSSIPQVEPRHNEPSGQGGKIFASAQWEERALSSGVRSARDPESTIFKNRNKLEKPDVKDFSFSSLLFAHAQWEERQNEHMPPAQNGAEQSRNEVQNVQKHHETGKSALEPTESDVDKRNKVSEGPVFFAHVQWEES
ncbi:hypothetical protein C8R45DRAFT_951310 [Mycena sanguinolenta]|nr:hypothetical protein C8R45DRAFT_951310 [Mycena sanguinolenta]